MFTFSINAIQQNPQRIAEVDAMPRRNTYGELGDSNSVNAWVSDLYLSAMKVTEPIKVCDSLEKYAYGCRKNTRLNRAKANSPDKPVWMREPAQFITQDDFEGGARGVIEGTEMLDTGSIEYARAQKEALAYEEADFYRYQLNQFIEMREYLFLEKEVDIAYCLVQAVESNMNAIAELRSLIAEFKGFDEIIKTLLSTENWLDDLRVLQTKPILCSC